MMQYLRRSIDVPNPYRRWIDPRHGSLRLSEVTAYLHHRGWKPLPPDRPGFLAFQEPTGEMISGKPVCQFVPDSQEYDNYALLMFELITGLAEFEDRQASEVIDDIMRLAGHDLPDGATQRQGRQAEVASR
jgi:hypothetical protein